MTDYREALRMRGVVPNSTWMRDGVEMYVVLPEDDESVQEIMVELGCAGLFENVADPDAYSTGWIRVAVIGLGNKGSAAVKTVFVPLFLGQIDKEQLKRIG